MGYYSDVYVHMPRNTYEALCEICLASPHKWFFKSVEYHDLGDEVILSWSGMKWYSRFDEVAMIENALRDLDEDGYEWYMLIHGEELGDIEEQCSESYSWSYEHTPYVSIGW